MPPPPTTRTHRALLVGTIAAASLVVLNACNIVAPVAYMVMGPEKAPAQFELDKARATVIFVDDRNSVAPDRSIRQRIAKGAEALLLDAHAVNDLIASESVLAATGVDRFGKPMGIVEVGEKVGAKVVVYATLDSFSLSTDGRTYQPTASMRVKVLDVETKKRIWPSPDSSELEWFPIQVVMHEEQGDAPKSIAQRTAASQKLADRLGLELGHLFVKHEAFQSNSRVGQ